MTIPEHKIQELAARLAAAGNVKPLDPDLMSEIKEASGGDREVFRAVMQAAYGDDNLDQGFKLFGTAIGRAIDYEPWLPEMDSAHLALWAITDVLGIANKYLARALGISAGRVTQLQDPTKPVPRNHRFALLGILDAAVEQYSAKVEVLAHRAPLVRQVRLAILELLTVIRNAERDALIPPIERA